MSTGSHFSDKRIRQNAACELISRHGYELIEQSVRVETDHRGEIEKFDHVQPALARFDIRDERLVAPKRGRYLCLRHPPTFAVLNDQLGQTLLAG